MAGFTFGRKQLTPKAIGTDRVGSGTISISLSVQSVVVPGLNPGDPQLLCVLRNNSSALVIIKESSSVFPLDGTAGIDYWSRTTTNLSLPINPPSDSSICYIPGATRADDLLAVGIGHTSFANNIVVLVKRGSDAANPFPANGLDGVVVWKITNNFVGVVINMRQITYAPGASLDQDLLIVPFAGGNCAYLPRGSGANPFPGSLNEDSLRRSIPRANIIGDAAHTVAGSVFIPHPSNSALDLIAFTNNTNSNTYLLFRGSGAASTHFSGGSANYTILTAANAGGISGLGRPHFWEHPTISALDCLALVGNNNIARIVLRNGSGGSFLGGAEGSNYIKVEIARYALDAGISAALHQKSTRLDDELLLTNYNSGRISTAYAWRLDAQPEVSEVELNTIEPAAPVFVNASDVTISGSVDFFTFTRYIISLIPLFGRSWTFVTDTSASGTLNTNLIFSGATAALTDNYALTMGAGTTVTLGSRSTYDEKITIPATGTLVIAGNVAITSDFILSAGTTVNKSGAGPYTLTIPYADPGLVLGSGVVLSVPQYTLSAPNIKDLSYPINVLLLRQETFTVADISAIINTTTNEITLTGHQFSTATPASFVTFIAQAGATVPQFSGGENLVTLGLYFVKSISGDAITLSKTEGGSTLDFVSAGSGAFAVIGWTQLDYQTVPAGSSTGYEVALNEANGTTLLLKARATQETTSPYTGTEYLIKTILWSASDQTIPDVLNFTDTPDEVYNLYCADPDLPASGAAVAWVSIDLNGTTGTLQLDLGTGVSATKRTEEIYQYFVHYTGTHEGLLHVGGVAGSLNEANLYVDSPVQLQNVNAGTVITLAGAFVRRSDGGQLVYADVSSGSIVLAPDTLAVGYTTSGGSGGATAAEVWGYGGRTLTGLPSIPTGWITAAGIATDAIAGIQNGLATAAALTTVSTVADAIKAKTDALPTDPADQSALEAAITAATAGLSTLNATAVQSAAAAALDAYDAAKASDVAVSGGFLSGDRTDLQAAKNYSEKLAAQLGLKSGVAATHSETEIVTSDGSADVTITDNGDGSYTVEGA